ncbi:MAG: GtrA family protein [Ruminococcaceae bacterium]|nr:GtrA family protein [Oscillospiraceae bacterium]
MATNSNHENNTAASSKKSLIFEFLRYAVVGGISALIDMGVLWLFTEFVFDGKNTGFPLTCSVTAGFVAGLIVNYLLSSLVVFTTHEQKNKSKSLKAFLIYAAVGVIGYLLTQGLMHLGMIFVSKDGIWYLVLNMFVKGVVLIWNYLGRKIFVYHGK